MKVIKQLIESMGVSIDYKVGRNAEENDNIIDQKRPNDIWFHMGTISSGHVVAIIPDDLILDKKQLKLIIVQGAVICKQHSKLKSTPNTEVVYTKIKNIEKTDIPGRVIIVNAKTIII